jgi:hypothetical protein
MSLPPQEHANPPVSEKQRETQLKWIPLPEISTSLQNSYGKGEREIPIEHKEALKRYIVSLVTEGLPTLNNKSNELIRCMVQADITPFKVLSEVSGEDRASAVVKLVSYSADSWNKTSSLYKITRKELKGWATSLVDLLTVVNSYSSNSGTLETLAKMFSGIVKTYSLKEVANPKSDNEYKINREVECLLPLLNELSENQDISRSSLTAAIVSLGTILNKTIPDLRDLIRNRVASPIGSRLFNVTDSLVEREEKAFKSLERLESEFSKEIFTVLKTLLFSYNVAIFDRSDFRDLLTSIANNESPNIVQAMFDCLAKCPPWIIGPLIFRANAYATKLIEDERTLPLEELRSRVEELLHKGTPGLERWRERRRLTEQDPRDKFRSEICTLIIKIKDGDQTDLKILSSYVDGVVKLVGEESLSFKQPCLTQAEEDFREGLKKWLLQFVIHGGYINNDVIGELVNRKFPSSHKDKSGPSIEEEVNEIMEALEQRHSSPLIPKKPGTSRAASPTSCELQESKNSLVYKGMMTLFQVFNKQTYFDYKQNIWESYLDECFRELSGETLYGLLYSIIASPFSSYDLKIKSVHQAITLFVPKKGDVHQTSFSLVEIEKLLRAAFWSGLSDGDTNFQASILQVLNHLRPRFTSVSPWWPPLILSYGCITVPWKSRMLLDSNFNAEVLNALNNLRNRSGRYLESQQARDGRTIVRLIQHALLSPSNNWEDRLSLVKAVWKIYLPEVAFQLYRGEFLIKVVNDLIRREEERRAESRDIGEILFLPKSQGKSTRIE